MSRLVLTVIGDDRAGLVEALSGVVNANGGNWEHSQMAELAGKFAGVIVVNVPDRRAAELTSALSTLDGLLEVSAYPGSHTDRAAQQLMTIHLLGNDRPGIVHEVSDVVARAGLGIDTMTTESRDAPMAGGRLFEANIVVGVPAGYDATSVRTGLERLASEIQVDIEMGRQ